MCPRDQAPLLTVSITSRPLPGVVTLVPQWQARLVLAFFPADDLATLSVANEIGSQPLEAGESAYCSFARRPPACGRGISHLLGQAGGVMAQSGSEPLDVASLDEVSSFGMNGG